MVWAESALMPMNQSCGKSDVLQESWPPQSSVFVPSNDLRHVELSLLFIKLYKGIVYQDTNYEPVTIRIFSSCVVVISLLYYCVWLFSNWIQLQRKQSFGNILNKQTKGTFAPAWQGNKLICNSKKKKKRKVACRLLNEIRYGVKVCCLSPSHFKVKIDSAQP